MRSDISKDWLISFISKKGFGACICEGQEINAACDELERLTKERTIILLEMEKALQKLKSLEQMKETSEWGPYAKAKAELHVKALIEEKDRKKAEKERDEETERCAVIAWHHFMDICQKRGLPPQSVEHWCAADTIRETIKQKVLHYEDLI